MEIVKHPREFDTVVECRWCGAQIRITDRDYGDGVKMHPCGHMVCMTCPVCSYEQHMMYDSLFFKGV
jgi:hypothetical protein